LLEAMAQGTPVVAIAELGTASILIEGQGASIATENVAEFADKVHGLLTQPKLRNTLGKAGKAYALNQWSANAKAQQMVIFYQDIITSCTAKPATRNLKVHTQT
jgi:1,2-diacylglycerol 3-alpha-glucosyltransferase